MKPTIGVLFPQVPFVHGGAEILIEELICNLKHHGFQAEIITVPFKWYPIDQLYNQMMLWRSIELPTQGMNKVDIVIGTKFPSYFIKHPYKLLWLIHQHRSAYDLAESIHSPFRDKPLELDRFRQTDKKMLQESNRIFTISQTVTNRLKKYNDLESTPLYHPPKLTGKYYCEQYDDYIFTVSRIDKMKRIDMLITAMKYTDKHIKCVIAGTGEQEKYLSKLINENKLNDRVKLLGYVNDQELLRLYAHCLGVYFAPIDEDLGYITLEAFSSKKPVITAHDSGGVLEFVKDNESGFISNPSPMAIADSINKLYQSKDKAKTMGMNGYESIQSISWNNVINTLKKEIREGGFLS